MGIINGTSASETLSGTSGDDTLNGLGGADVINASGGADILNGGDGDDTLNGGQGVDSYDGGAGNDFVGSDQNGLAGAQIIYTGVGSGTYRDVYGNLESFINIETTGGTSGADQFTGGAGDEQFNSYGGTDTVVGGTGFDVLALTSGNGNGFGGINATLGATVNFLTGTITGAYAGGATITFSGIERVRGTNFGDTFIGGNDAHSNYSFRGLGGADTYTGGTGLNDQIDYFGDASAGGAAGVTVNLLAGTATDGFSNAETMTGIENVRGTNAVDTMTGNASDNSFNGFGGADTLNGGDGDDTLNGGNGIDNLNGGNGLDWVSNARDTFYDGGTLGITVNLLTQRQTDAFGNIDILTSIENAAGTQLVDIFIGDAGDNIFRGYQGNDSFDGGGGIDSVQAFGSGALEIWQDELARIQIGTQGWVVNVGAGTIIDQFGNTDTIANIERFRATMLVDTMTGAAGTQYFQGLAGADIINGGADSDWVEYHNDANYGGTAGVTVNLLAGTGVDGFGATDALSSIENVRGTESNDTITGNNDANILKGDGGNDTLNGGDGNDTLVGGTHGVGGWNTLNGGNGSDTVDYSAETGTVYADLGLSVGYINNGSGYVFNDALSLLENLTGGSGNDQLTGDGNANVLNGGGGNDVINGGGGDDTILGGGHNLGGYDVLYGEGGVDTASFTGVTGAVYADLLIGSPFGVGYVNTGSGFVHDSLLFGFENLTGGSGNDILLGDNNANVLTGGDGADFMLGQGGNDTLIGGNGNDSLYGGDGNDRFVFDANLDIATGGTGADVFFWNSMIQGADAVSDFSHAEGDKINLDAAAFGVPVGWTLSAGFNFISGTGAVSTNATATIIFDTTTNILWYDIDGTGASGRQAITFLSNGGGGITASDIVFV